MPEVTALSVSQIRSARAELQAAWDRRDWNALMTREKSVRLLAEGAFSRQVPDGELRQELMALQQQYLAIVEEMTEERNQLKELLVQSSKNGGNRLRAVQQYRVTGRMKDN
ncbi:hypothetical protein [Sansalvadorimonas verongulae]|uniref:hypothetical protein n=1 Tax=Sansalvadorimonas verongulae TaxID=2172824 RepID=UPI0012BBEA59|nr:hypothetical protein [Sansalvadorimonas verongulae]MTI13258.1 hypothetical protein [Sansalvadorimonas verongulae]